MTPDSVVGLYLGHSSSQPHGNVRRHQVDEAETHGAFVTVHDDLPTSIGQ